MFLTDAGFAEDQCRHITLQQESHLLIESFHAGGFPAHDVFGKLQRARLCVRRLRIETAERFRSESLGKP